MLEGTGSVHELPLQHIGGVIWRAGIALGIGDDDAVSGVVESDQTSEQAARDWVTQILPETALPEWVLHRPHGAAGAFLHGSVERGYLTQHDHTLDWEPDTDTPSWDADLVDISVRWRQDR
ncbi:hypothetical protein [Amycolatopsis sp. H20-H5]|uniref:hypothetical protein n=1 Tax=Amycolatopsis sp. H20-H5 TaxID=3046309 RepID=UPI002DBC4607|nr:hypothetical protein [Amycolatopsis sp. H20-H5]MEC3977422.1 hypothetical protein [Amycolatopsis sp. H20-H5]